MSEPKIAPMTITPEEIPDKLYFRIGEVARLAGIKPYVLRFWETEFPALDPKKSGTGHRLYRRKEVQLVLEIKRLLYEKRFTIEGARKFLDTRSKKWRSRRVGSRGRFEKVCRQAVRAGQANPNGILRRSVTPARNGAQGIAGNRSAIEVNSERTARGALDGF